MKRFIQLAAGSLFFSALVLTPAFGEGGTRTSTAPATQVPNADTVRNPAPTADTVVTPADSGDDAARLAPAVLNRMNARENEMDTLAKSIRDLRPKMAAMNPAQKAVAQESLTAMENRFARLHLSQVQDGMVWMPLQIPFGLMTGAGRAVGRAMGNPNASGTLLRPEGAPGVGELREILENAGDLRAASAAVRRITRDMTESQVRKEQEIKDLRASIKAESEGLEADDRRMRAQGKSDVEINAAFAARDEAFERREEAAKQRMMVLDAEIEYLRTIKSSATMFLITHGMELPGGLALMGQGALDLVSGNFAEGAAKMAAGGAIASPAGLDVGCWAGQCLVWGPTRSLVNSSREFIAAKGGALMEKLLYENAGKKTPKELVDLLVKNGVSPVLSIKTEGGSTSVSILNKKGQQAVTMAFRIQPNGQMHLENMSVNKAALSDLDFNVAMEEVGKLGWDVKDAFNHLMKDAMDPELAKKIDPSGKSFIGRYAIQPAIRAIEGDEKPGLPGFVDGEAKIEGDKVSYAIHDGKVRIEPSRQTKPWLQAASRALAPLTNLLGPSARDIWSGIGFGLEKTGELGVAAASKGVEKAGDAQRVLASAGEAVANGPVGEACFNGWKAMTLGNTK